MAIVTCAECGAELLRKETSATLEDEDRAPCPVCRSHARHTAVEITDRITVTSKGDWETVRHVGARPWQEMWGAAERQLQDLEGRYTNDPKASTGPLEDVVQAFCLYCYHLQDHLRSDPAVPAAVQASVPSFVNKSPALALTREIANTHKHHTRSHPNAIWAGIATVNSAPRATIGWKDPSTGAGGTQDVFDLAREAAGEWRRFFLQYGL